MDIGRETIIHQHYEELVKFYHDLNLSENKTDKWVIRGNLHFRATYNTITIEDNFNVLLVLPNDYPLSPPLAQETGGRIPLDVDDHVYPSTSDLCLGAPLNIKLKFLGNPCLLYFVTDILIPFLYSFCYKQQYGKMPYGERSHGAKGILEDYQELFGVQDIKSTLGLLKILADNTYRGHHPCSCDSGAILRKCHGAQLQNLMSIQSSKQFQREMIYILKSLSEESIKSLNRRMFPKDLQKRLEKFTSKNKDKN